MEPVIIGVAGLTILLSAIWAVARKHTRARGHLPSHDLRQLGKS